MDIYYIQAVFANERAAQIAMYNVRCAFFFSFLLNASSKVISHNLFQNHGYVSETLKIKLQQCSCYEKWSEPNIVIEKIKTNKKTESTMETNEKTESTT